MKASEPKPTKEEILKSKFKSSFLDLDYLELYLEAMQEYAEQFHKDKMREELCIAFKYNWSGNSFFSSGDFDTDFEKWYNEIYLKPKQ